MVPKQKVTKSSMLSRVANNVVSLSTASHIIRRRLRGYGIVKCSKLSLMQVMLDQLQFLWDVRIPVLHLFHLRLLDYVVVSTMEDGGRTINGIPLESDIIVFKWKHDSAICNDEEDQTTTRCLCLLQREEDSMWWRTTMWHLRGEIRSADHHRSE